jgi:phosphoribosyl 1,2-cyclic phosphate phosphodiesterase
MEVKILGCGASLGVPVLACNCNVCASHSMYNKRLRPSILIRNNDTQILVDSGPDIKRQLMREQITQLDAVILTHDHADHVSGLDELRVFSFFNKEPLKIYTDYNTARRIMAKFGYMADEKKITMHELEDFTTEVQINSINLQFFRQHHGVIDSLGIKLNKFVYSNDVIEYPISSEKFLYNLEDLVIDCMDYTSTKAHSGLDKVLEWNKKYQPKRMWLTNMSHSIDYQEIKTHLPNNIKPLYDQKIIKID